MGADGFNQSYGRRGHKFPFSNYHNWLKIKESLKHTKLYNDNYKNIFDRFDNKNTIWFLDPPYMESGEVYESFNKLDIDEYLDQIKNLKGKVLYTDIYSDKIQNKLDWNYTKIRDLRKISPNRADNEIIGDEVVFYNFDTNFKKLF